MKTPSGVTIDLPPDVAASMSVILVNQPAERARRSKVFWILYRRDIGTTVAVADAAKVISRSFYSSIIEY